VDSHATEAADPDAVRLAVWFHDAVYDPRRTDNEDASAALAARVLPTAGVPVPTVAAVTRLVRLTATHDPAPDDTDGALLCDADLAVLAGDPGEYAAYAAAVRAEYAHVPTEAFRLGRAAVLRRLCALPTLYRLPSLRDRWEERARANLAGELQSLGS
jgi:predicted metal-dependent HD superfamily phosphohydrolase